jgi:hypothetical protein
MHQKAESILILFSQWEQPLLMVVCGQVCVELSNWLFNVTVSNDQQSIGQLNLFL